MTSAEKNTMAQFVGCIPLEELYELRKTMEYLKEQVEDLDTCYPFGPQFDEELECAIKEREQMLYALHAEEEENTIAAEQYAPDDPRLVK
jgi:hypothetical protein